jgi:hypothetical protein
MGKTWVLHLAIARKPDWAIPLFFNAEDLDSAPTFVWKLNKILHDRKLIPSKCYNTVTKWYDKLRRTLQRLQKQNLGKIIIPDIDPWEGLLHDTCASFVKHNTGMNPILIIDELPFFLDKLIKAKSHNHAIQLLDNLRAIRHEHTSLRMVFCGSLGLHIVMSQLKEIGYSGRPFNDMPPFEVNPLDDIDSQYLAGCLISGENLSCTDIEDVAKSASEAGCNVPFYIQHIIKWMRDNPETKGKIWTPEEVKAIPESWFQSGEDPADLEYYDERLDIYYPEDMREKARVILNVLSKENAGLIMDEILNLVRHHPKTLICDMEQVSKVIDTLHKDHYLIKHNDNWKFKLEIVRKWWWNKKGRYGL